MTDHLITGKPLWSEPAQETRFKSNHPYAISLLWLSWMVIYQTLVGCNAILTENKSQKWRQRPNMTLAVDWDVKHQFKQTYNTPCFFSIYTYIIPINLKWRDCSRYNLQYGSEGNFKGLS